MLAESHRHSCRLKATGTPARKSAQSCWSCCIHPPLVSCPRPCTTLPLISISIPPLAHAIPLCSVRLFLNNNVDYDWDCDREDDEDARAELASELIITAAQLGHVEMVRMLVVEFGADVETTCHVK